MLPVTIGESQAESGGFG